MVNNLSKLLENKVTFIIGSEKNVGKTTFFNLARGAIKGTRHLLATIGVDGEKQDLVHGNTKPQILVDTDEYVVTTDSMLNSSDAELELVEIFPFKTVLGRMSIARVLRQGTLELVGPGSNEQLSHILEYAKNELNINTMLIDGAINRITQISSSSKTSLAKASFIYVLTVTQNNINSSIDKMKLIYELSKCQDDNNGKVMSADHYYLPGALTTDKLS
ncbi:MAG: hypothetical protein NTY22_02430, partial [Proteobacteria bacterium]|nr:hypothetical protein [Pseudomonadota bacterium]